MIDITTKGHGICGGDTILVAGDESVAITMRELPSITINGPHRTRVLGRDQIASITVTR